MIRAERELNLDRARRHLTRQETQAPRPRGQEEQDGREALRLLDTLARGEERRFGRLTVTITDGRVVDIEVTEKIDGGTVPAV